MELSPLMLPLKPGVFEDKKRTFGGIFGVFNDSLPDGWGCLLLDRKLRKGGRSYAEITPLDRLSMIGCSPMGALEYEPAEPASNTFGHLELDSLSSEVAQILSGDDSVVLDELLQLNGSSGGARPKIVAWVSNDRKQIIHGRAEMPDGFAPWLIKFTEAKDGPQSGVIEYLYSLTAKQAGIDMPPTHLFPSTKGPGYFGVQRFDRIGMEKVHVHTACGLLHASHRYSGLDYENLLRLTMVLTKDEREVEKMARLMIFNVKAGNRDDHSKNFSFIMTRNYEWKLAPAYDLTPSPGINGEQTAMVNGKGTDITDEDLIVAAAAAGISAVRIREMIQEVDAALGTLLQLKREYGLR
jgi:serine/threonine-protein kinase HipA